MTYSIRLPDGSLVENIPDDVTPEEAKRRILAQFPELGGGRRKSTVMSELSGGLQRLGSQFRTSIGALSDPNAAAVAGVERGQEIGQEVGESPSLAALRDRYQTEGVLGAAKQAAGDLPRALAAQVPQLGAMAAGAKLGAMAGAPLGGPIGAGVGAALGAGATLLPQFFGANLERQAQEQQAAGSPVDIDRSNAAIGAVAQSGVEAAGTAFVLGKRLVKGLLGIADDAALRTPQARQTFLRAVTAGAARGTAEVPVEIAQQAIERAQAGLDVLSDDALEEYGEAAYQALLVGPTIGAAGNVIQRSRDDEAQTEATSTEAPIDRLRREAREAEQRAAAERATEFRILTPDELDAIAATDDGYAKLAGYKAQLQSQPKSKQRDAALKQVTDRLVALNVPLAEQTIAAREGVQREAELAAESAFAQPGVEPDMFGVIVPRQAAPVEETPAPRILTPEDVRGIGFAPHKSPNSLYAKLVGQDLTDPGDVAYVRETLIGYRNRSNPSNATSQKIDAFLATLPEPTVEVDPTQGELDPAPPPRVRAKGERNGRQPATTDTGTTVAPVEPASSAPSVESLGLANESDGRDTAVAPDATRVGVSEPTTVVDNAGEVQQPSAVKQRAQSSSTPSTSVIGSAFDTIDAQLDRTVARLDAQRAETEAAALQSDVARIKQELKDLQDARDALRTRGGAILEGDQAAFDEASERILQYQEMLADLVPKLSRARNAANAGKRGKGRTKKDTQPALSDLPDTTPAEQANREVVEAVGAYNNPSSDALRRKNATDFLFAVANGEIADYSSAREVARKALKFGVDPKDLTKPQQLAYDTLTKDVKDDDTQWGSYLYQKGGAYDTPIFEQQRIARVLRNIPNVRDIAAWIARTAPDPTYRRIALKVSDRLRAMERDGFIFSLEVKNNMPEQLGYVFFSPNEGNKHARIAIRAPGDGPYSGANYTTILHELLHAVTASAIRSDANKVLRDRLQSQLDHINDVIKNAKDNDLIEMILQGRMYNAFQNVDELVAWTLSDPYARNVLSKIPAKDQPSRSIWQKIRDAIRAFLGLSNAQESVLSDIMNNGEALLLTDPIDDVTMGEVGMSLVGGQANMPAPLAGPELVGQRDERGYTRRVYDRLGGNKAIGIRSLFTDSIASFGNKAATQYGGRVKDAEGNINPEVLLSQALQNDRFSSASQKYGYMTFRDGMPIVEELTITGDLAKLFPDIAGEKVSYTGAMAEITKEARRQGVEVATLQKRLDEIYAGRREHYLYKLQDQGKGPFAFGLTRDQAAARNAEFEADPFAKRVSHMLDAVRFKHIDFLVDSGRISKDTATEWKTTTGYIPFDRIDDAESLYSAITGSNRGLATYKSRGKFVGSAEKLTSSPLEEMSRLIDWMVMEGMKAHAVKRAMDDMTLWGDAKMIANPEAAPNKDQVVKAFKDGVPKFYYVNDPLDVAAFSIAPNSVSDVVRGFQKFSQVLRAGVTSMPPFVLKQIADDIYRVYAYSELKNPGRAVIDILKNFPKNWFNEALGRKTPAVMELEKRGIVGSFDFTEIGNLKNVLEDAGVKSRSLPGKLLHVMEAGARAQDMTVRQAIYNQMMRETNDPVYAESQAREIINFSRRGSARIMDTLIRTIPFFNAYARGMDKVLVAATGGRGVGKVTGQARAKFYSRMMKLTALGLTYALVMQNDEEYNKLDDHVRDRNWVLPFGKELGYRYVLPVPEELAFMFKAIPERVVQYYRTQGTPEERDGLRVLGEMVAAGGSLVATPNLAPQALRSIIENMVNYSFFLGRPLESVSQLRDDPHMRFTMSTSETMKDVSAWMARTTGVPEISPIKLENLVRGLMGTTGGIMLEMADSLTNPTRTDRPLHRNLPVMMTGASAFLKDPVGSRYTTLLYDLKEQADRVKNTYNDYLKSDPAKADEYIRRNYGLYAIEPRIKGLADELSQLQADARYIDQNKDISPEDRREAIDLIRYKQQEIAREAVMLRAEAERLRSEMRATL